MFRAIVPDGIEFQLSAISKPCKTGTRQGGLLAAKELATAHAEKTGLKEITTRALRKNLAVLFSPVISARIVRKYFCCNNSDPVLPLFYRGMEAGK